MSNGALKSKDGLWYLENKYKMRRVKSRSSDGLLPIGVYQKDVQSCAQTLELAALINVDMQYATYTHNKDEYNGLKECLRIVRTIALDRRKAELKHPNTSLPKQKQKRNELPWASSLMERYGIEAYIDGGKINLRDHRKDPPQNMEYDGFFMVLKWIKKDLSDIRKRARLFEKQNYSPHLQVVKRVNQELPMLEGLHRLIVNAINTYKPAITISELDAKISKEHTNALNGDSGLCNLQTLEKLDGNTLFVCKGRIKCEQDKHSVIQATAILGDRQGNDIALNVSYCKDCNIFFIPYASYKIYREKYGIILGNIQMVSDNITNTKMDLADESPLRLCGYSVNQKSCLSLDERRLIMVSCIVNNVMTKGEIIRLLNWLIDMNEHIENHSRAVAAWKSDLAFISEYDMQNQEKHRIGNIEVYRKNRFALTEIRKDEKK